MSRTPQNAADTGTNLPISKLEDYKNPTPLMKFRDKYLLDSVERKLRETGRFTADNAGLLPILARRTVIGIKQAVCRLGGYQDGGMSSGEAMRYKGQYPNEFNFLMLITLLKDEGMDEQVILAKLKQDFPGK